MRDVSKLRTFINATSGGRSAKAAPSSPRAVEPPVDSGRDAVGVNGASVNDIAALLDYVAAPVSGPPVWAADRVVWNAALRGLGVENVDGDEKLYEAAAYSYHSLGGALVTNTDMEEEVEEVEASQSNDNSLLNQAGTAPEALFEDGLEAEEQAIEDGEEEIEEFGNTAEVASPDDDDEFDDDDDDDD